MIDYQDQAKQFLLDCNATMEIKFVGKEIPAHWKGETKPHNKYQFTITTPKGKYTNYFWDSLHNTEASEMTAEDYAKRSTRHATKTSQCSTRVECCKTSSPSKQK